MKLYSIHDYAEGFGQTNWVGKFNLDKPLCPVTNQPIDRTLPWYFEPFRVHCSRYGSQETRPIYSNSLSPLVLVKEEFKLFLESASYPVRFHAVARVPFNPDRDEGSVVDTFSLFWMEVLNLLPMNLEASGVEWQTNCPGCGRTYPLFHTHKSIIVNVKKSEDTRIFALSQWPDSWAFLPLSTLKEWKKNGFFWTPKPQSVGELNLL